MKIVPQSVELVDHMGSDLSVVNAARVSFHKESEWEYPCNIGCKDGCEHYATSGCCPDKRERKKVLSEKDAKLIGYLAKHGHWTPFGHAFLSFRIKAPIFVARQLVKHQVGLVWNEVSRRYVDDEPEFWFPDVWRGKPVNAKQGSDGVVELNFDFAGQVAMVALGAYQHMLDAGVAPEQARMVLPLNTMTEWIWSGSLMAFARVCKLRLDAHAQAETREVARDIAGIACKLFPCSWEALIMT